VVTSNVAGVQAVFLHAPPPSQYPAVGQQTSRHFAMLPVVPAAESRGCGPTPPAQVTPNNF